ncbi:MAG: CTP synthase [Bacteroidaceae bacterium]|nr:CTP synthase [Bacteroidaceae bacterium]
MNQTKYIFVTGGVVSSLGKGIIAASIGKLLQARGYKITIQKFDPYINIDPGTLNPYEHGECYVTADGCETDLDLGHYERFTDIHTTRANNVTTGKIYQNVIERERKGEYLGHTVQVVPHITDEIKYRMLLLGKTGEYDFIITEIGGTVGDIEGLPFLEAMRQLKRELGRNAVCVHLTYVPYIAAAGELKTKPTQHSVKELQGLGLQPDILVLRAEHELGRGVLDKVADFCNVENDSVIQSIDLPTIYEVPLRMAEQKLDIVILGKFGIQATGSADLCAWHNFLERRKHATKEIHIALVGKYDLQDAYKSILECLSQAGTYNDSNVITHFIQSEDITTENIATKLSSMDGVVICPGFGQRGIEGKITAAGYCRTHNIPTLGICLGMQIMVIEFARNVLALPDADSFEINPDTPHKVIDLMEEQKNITNMGGTMRLGEYACELVADSKAYEAYGTPRIKERHRHRYEFNNHYRKQFEQAGMVCTGINPDSGLVEIVEVPACRWYVGVQFHPEYTGTVLHPNPLFVAFVRSITHTLRESNTH